MSEHDMDAVNSGDESDHELISTEMLEDIRDGRQTHPNMKRIDARYKTRDHIRQIKSEWKGALKATQNMGKGLHKLFLTSVKYISQDFHLWENLVQKFPISFQNLETLLKWFFSENIKKP